MSVLQKIIKYLAFAFAVFLTFSIIFSLMYGFSFLGNIFDGNKEYLVPGHVDQRVLDDMVEFINMYSK